MYGQLGAENISHYNKIILHALHSNPVHAQVLRQQGFSMALDNVLRKYDMTFTLFK